MKQKKKAKKITATPPPPPSTTPLEKTLHSRQKAAFVTHHNYYGFSLL